MTTNSNQQRGNNDANRADVVIVGGGLGGLATAALLGRAGLRVIVCERAAAPGGRGRSLDRSGFSLNLGPHALYAAGSGAALLRGLGIEPRGRRPDGQGFVIRDDREHVTPTSPLTMMSTSLLDLRSKFELMRLFARIGRISCVGLEQLSMAQWLTREVASPEVRRLLAAFIRIGTFCGELDTLSADAAVAQLQLAMRGVLYLDGGWQQLVDALVERCVAAGVELVCDARVTSVGRSDGSRWAVQLDDRTLRCEHVVVAGSPALADALLGPVLGGPRFAAGTRPLRLASLDLGIRGPWSGPAAVFNLDEPILFSLVSQFAAVAPEGHSLLALAWYRREGDDEVPATELRARLERSASRWLPDWRSALVVEQFLPDMTVSHDRPQPGRGLAGRWPAVIGDGLYLVGDWVGDHGLLLDASLASATTVGDAVLAPAEHHRSPGEPRLATMRH